MEHCCITDLTAIASTQILASNLVLAILLITTLKHKMFLSFSFYANALSLLNSLLFPVSILITAFYLGALQWSTLDSSSSKVDTDEKAKKCSREDMFMEMLKCPGTAKEQWYERALRDLEQEEKHVKEAEELSFWVHKNIMKLLMQQKKQVDCQVWNTESSPLSTRYSKRGMWMGLSAINALLNIVPKTNNKKSKSMISCRQTSQQCSLEVPCAFFASSLWYSHFPVLTVLEQIYPLMFSEHRRDNNVLG